MRRAVLIIHPGALGDVLLALPAIRALRQRFQDHDHLLLAGEDVGGLLQACREVDLAIPLEGGTLASILAGERGPWGRESSWIERCDLAVGWLRDSEQQLSRALRSLGAREVIVRSPLDAARHVRHQTDRFLDAVRSLGARGKHDQHLALPEAAVEVGRRLFAGLAQGDSRGLVVLAPGSGSRHKCALPALFAETLAELRARRWTPILLGGPADAAAVADVKAACPFVPAIVKDQDLLSVAGLLAQVEAYIGHDSGLTHLAAALHRPTVALFGPTDRDRWAPRGARVMVVTGQPCGCDGWSAVQACLDKPCLRIPASRLVEVCEGAIHQARQGVPSSMRREASSCSAR